MNRSEAAAEILMCAAQVLVNTKGIEYVSIRQENDKGQYGLVVVSMEDWVNDLYATLEELPDFKEVERTNVCRDAIYHNRLAVEFWYNTVTITEEENKEEVKMENTRVNVKDIVAKVNRVKKAYDEVLINVLFNRIGCPGCGKIEAGIEQPLTIVTSKEDVENKLNHIPALFNAFDVAVIMDKLVVAVEGTFVKECPACRKPVTPVKPVAPAAPVVGNDMAAAMALVRKKTANGYLYENATVKGLYDGKECVCKFAGVERRGLVYTGHFKCGVNDRTDMYFKYDPKNNTGKPFVKQNGHLLEDLFIKKGMDAEQVIEAKAKMAKVVAFVVSAFEAFGNEMSRLGKERLQKPQSNGADAAPKTVDIDMVTDEELESMLQ